MRSDTAALLVLADDIHWWAVVNQENGAQVHARRCRAFVRLTPRGAEARLFPAARWESHVPGRFELQLQDRHGRPLLVVQSPFQSAPALTRVDMETFTWGVVV